MNELIKQPCSIVAVITCFNRKEKTVNALDAIYAAKGSSHLSGILVDDGSIDGTREAVSKRFDWVEIISGNGNLFWCGGMRTGMSRAMEKCPDYILWLNDDTQLYEGAIDTLVRIANSMNEQIGLNGIVVGSACDEIGKVSYGGMKQTSSLIPTRFSLIKPTTEAQPCDAMNGNCVLISREAYERLGNLSSNYVHSMGDIDYALRAKSKGIPVWVAPGFVGLCVNDNVAEGSFNDKGLSFKNRWELITSPKALPPRAWAAFCKSHCGFIWPLAWAWPYFKVVLSGLLSFKWKL